MNDVSTVALTVTTVYPKTEIKEYLVPVLQEITKKQRKGKTLIVGIQGGQGTGKTTLGRFLAAVLTKAGYRVTAFSLDDFYEPLAQRHLLQRLYPDNVFYQIPRGMPGTHRVIDLYRTLQRIRAGRPFELPVFDKAKFGGEGDITGTKRRIMARQDIVLFEGWCLGLPPVSSSELVAICKRNRVPIQRIDPDYNDHRVMLQYIPKYQPLWKFIGFMIILNAGSPELHRQWRWQQEQELIRKRGKGMTKNEIRHFVNVYLPLTYVCYEKAAADVRLMLNAQHRIYSVVHA